MVRTLAASPQAVAAGRLPDFLLIGAPKAGTTALHAAPTGHPELFLSPVKEPKYYLCGDSPPPAYRGPGDAHSNREWIWQRQRYLDPFEGADEHQLAAESTPFYLYHRDARRRIASDLPEARLVAVLRDPVDRAYSNWQHLWVDGLEPCGDVLEHFPREQVLLVRYRELVEEPHATLNTVCRFLGVAQDVLTEVPSGNSRPFVTPSIRTRLLGPVVRSGARAGSSCRRSLAQGQRAAHRTAAPQRQPRPAAPHPRAAGRAASLVPGRHRPPQGGHRELLRRLAGDPRRRLLRLPLGRRPARLTKRPHSAAGGDQPASAETLVIRSWAPSGRAASK